MKINLYPLINLQHHVLVNPGGSRLTEVNDPALIPADVMDEHHATTEKSVRYSHSLFLIHHTLNQFL